MLSVSDPAHYADWERMLAGDLPVTLDDVFWSELGDGLPPGVATRQSSQQVLSALCSSVPELVGGSADLAGSTGTKVGARSVHRDDYSGSRIDFGIREFAMATVLNGISLHGGFRCFGSTFLVFSDYLRPALRLSALMGQPIVYVLTHDSVAVGEDGPTHQPVEHVESLRLIPNVRVVRPADARETSEAWRSAMKRSDGPTVLVLSRQSLPECSPTAELGFIDELGHRVVQDVVDPDVDLVASGSEVALALKAASLLNDDGLKVRVTSVPWRERYAATRGRSTPARITVALEAGATSGWSGLADAVIGVDSFGFSGVGSAVQQHVGLSPSAVVSAVHQALASSSRPLDLTS